MAISKRKILLKVLKKIRDEGVINHNKSLCVNILLMQKTFGEKKIQEARLYCTFLGLTALWPARNPSEHFPVDGPAEYYDSVLACSHWDNTRRHELLHWIIMYLENQ